MTKLFRAGKHPNNTFLPYCQICQLPVVKLQYRIPKEDSWTVDFDAQCCGKTMGRRITLAEMERLRVTGEKFFLVVRKGRTQQIKAQARR